MVGCAVDCSDGMRKRFHDRREVVQVACVDCRSSVNNAANGGALGAAQNLTKLQDDVGEAGLDWDGEDAPCGSSGGQDDGGDIWHLEHKDCRPGGDGAGGGHARHRASNRALAMDGKDSIVNLLLVVGVHVLVVCDASPLALLPQLLDPLKVLFVILGRPLGDSRVRGAWAVDLLVLHPRVVAAATKTVLAPCCVPVDERLDAFAIAGKRPLRLAVEGRGVVVQDARVEALPQQTSGNVLHAFDLVLRSLHRGEDDGKLLALIRAIQIMNGRMQGVRQRKLGTRRQSRP
jgi:hypothetical protein